MNTETIAAMPSFNILILRLLGKLFFAGQGFGKVSWAWLVHVSSIAQFLLILSVIGATASGKFTFPTLFRTHKTWKVYFGWVKSSNKNKPPPDKER